MRTITTRTGTTEVIFAWSPTFDGKCMIQLHDDRRLSEIAADYDGLDSITYTDEDAEQVYEWEGYSVLDGIVTASPGVVQITLRRGD